MAKVTFYPSMEYMLKYPEGDVGRYLWKRGEWIQNAARRQVGVKTGALRKSIYRRRFVDSRGIYLIVGSNLNYALMHHQGTKPHIITPNNARALKFSKRGTTVYARAVMHPGTRANKYLSDNLWIALIR
jgi:hypothetical protein